jgi:predicted nucleotidyltransferase
MADTRGFPHQRAAEAFAEQARSQYGDALDAILLYGSAARDEQRGVDSDVDLLVILQDDADKPTVEARIRDLAYDIELGYEVVLSLIVRTNTEFERDEHRPFFQQVQQDGKHLYG